MEEENYRDVYAIMVNSMARTLFVDQWANEEEEQGRCYSGQNLMDVAPETPSEYRDEALRLVGHMEAANGMAFVCLAYKAFVADGLTTYEDDDGWDKVTDDVLEEFGHYVAMASLGHGVCWEDDRADAGIEYPHFCTHI